MCLRFEEISAASECAKMKFEMIVQLMESFYTKFTKQFWRK